MGNGIAHVFARTGHDVVLCDVERRVLDRGLDTIGKNLDREVAKNKITAADKATALGRITPVLERAKLSECQLVVEAATEKFEIKAELFRELDRICFVSQIFANEYPPAPQVVQRQVVLRIKASERIGNTPAIRCAKERANQAVAIHRVQREAVEVHQHAGHGERCDNRGLARILCGHHPRT